MTNQESPQHTLDRVERNTNRIDRLVHEVEKLVELLEAQRLVDPTALVALTRELHEIQSGQ